VRSDLLFCAQPSHFGIADFGFWIERGTCGVS
jgi:hypothetical protein